MVLERPDADTALVVSDPILDESKHPEFMAPSTDGADIAVVLPEADSEASDAEDDREAGSDASNTFTYRSFSFHTQQARMHERVSVLHDLGPSIAEAHQPDDAPPPGAADKLWTARSKPLRCDVSSQQTSLKGEDAWVSGEIELGGRRYVICAPPPTRVGAHPASPRPASPTFFPQRPLSAPCSSRRRAHARVNGADGMFDGHGGAQAAVRCAANLLPYVSAAAAQTAGGGATLEDLACATKRAFEQLHAEIRALDEGTCTAGTTAGVIIADLEARQVLACNVGDSARARPAGARARAARPGGR